MSRTPSRTLKLTYLGDASQLSQSTKGANDQVKGLGDRVKDVGKKLAVGFAAISAAGIAMGKKLFDAFEEVSTANARIESIVDSMGNFEGQVGDVTQKLIDQANATAALTGVDRTLIKESQALLLTFDSVNKTADQSEGIFDRATDAAIDLAAAGFGSATSNAQSLGRALEDPIKGLTSLTRQGVTFTDEQRDVIKAFVDTNEIGQAQEVILAAIEKQVGGTAEATANGSDRMRQQFGILRDTLAMALAPAFERIIELGLSLISRVADWWDRNGEAIIETFRRWGSRIGDTAKSFRDFAKDVIDELGGRGAIERLKGAGSGVAEAWRDTRAAFSSFRESLGLVGGDASAFATIIDIGYIKPLEFLLDRLEKALGALEKFFEFAEKVRDLLGAGNIVGQVLRDSFSERASNLGPFAGVGDAFRAGGVRGATGQIVVNVTGAVDPEGTARTIERVLNDQRARGTTGGPAFAQ